MRYPVPKRRLRTEYRQGNSRFITTIGRAETMEEAKAFLQSIRDEMPDATHHVYAMKIGYGASVTEGMSDDGEPSGTSGPPVLAILRGEELGDVVVVVTRYFGGTKLGTGGLVTAYSNAARQGLDALEREEKVDRRPARLVVDYSLYEPVKRALAEHEAVLESEDFAENVTIFAAVPEEKTGNLIRAVKDLSSGEVVVELLDQPQGS